MSPLSRFNKIFQYWFNKSSVSNISLVKDGLLWGSASQQGYIRRMYTAVGQLGGHGNLLGVISVWVSAGCTSRVVAPMMKAPSWSMCEVSLPPHFKTTLMLKPWY